MQFPTLRHFERAASVGLIAQCPDCYRIFGCDKNNMYCDTTGFGKPENFPLPPHHRPGPGGSAAGEG